MIDENTLLPTSKTFRCVSNDIKHNFNVSVVMPFYKKLDAFKKVFPKNQKYFERNGIEIVIVLDCLDERNELLEYIMNYPFINWKLIFNNKRHDWRNPAKPINVGIKNATKKYIMVCSPESEFYSDAILQFCQILVDYPDHYAVGTVCFSEFDEKITEANISDYNFINYGSIMANKSYFHAIKGYDEALNKWGGDDDNIRARLDLLGVEMLLMPEVRLIHREQNCKKGNERRNTPFEIIEHLLYPKSTIVNEVWGDDFDNIIYDWRNNIYADVLLNRYLSDFEKYYLKPYSTTQKFDKVLLVSAYNEEDNINTFIKYNSKYFDAIIVLDDGSTDNTFEVFKDDKIILKIKKEREGFNDLKNRNILLNSVSFFKCEWICFIDIDEILETRYFDFNYFNENNDIDSILLNIIHLWDSEDKYNADYPYTYNGIGLKLRMFRNIGRAQIISNQGKLHFIPVPYTGNIFHAPLLIKHYGHISAKSRKNKHDFYAKEDAENCQNDYSHLLQNQIRKRNVEDISIDELRDAISIYF